MEDKHNHFRYLVNRYLNGTITAGEFDELWNTMNVVDNTELLTEELQKL